MFSSHHEQNVAPQACSYLSYRLRRICATLLTPFAVTLNLDADALPCGANWTAIFAEGDGKDVVALSGEFS